MAKQGPSVKSCIAPLYLFICSERFARRLAYRTGQTDILDRPLNLLSFPIC